MLLAVDSLPPELELLLPLLLESDDELDEELLSAGLLSVLLPSPLLEPSPALFSSRARFFVP